MKNIKEYLRSVSFSLSYSFRHTPKESLITVVLMIIVGTLPYGSAYLLGRLVNLIVEGAKSGSYIAILYVLIMYTFVTALPSILANFRSFIRRKAALTLTKEIELAVLKRREQIDIARYEDPKFQDLIQRTFRNGYMPIFLLADGQFDVIRSLTSFIVGTVLAVHFNLWIYVIVVVLAMPGFFIDIKFASSTWLIWRNDSPEQRKYNDLKQHIIQRISLIETKLLQAGGKIISSIRKILTDFEDKQLKLERKKLVYTSIGDLLAFVGFAIGLFLLLEPVMSGAVLVGTLVYMMSTLSNVRSSIGSLLMDISSQYDNHLIVKDLIEFMGTKPSVIESKNPTILNLETAPEIVFQNVSFKYPGSENWNLRNLNMTFKSGQKIGLVGNNGAGKTTLVKLLCRVYDPTEGRILVNGVDLRDISTKEWWSYLGIMFQDYANYDFLVKEAIAIGRPDKTIDVSKVKNAAEMSQAQTFIEEWKDTYDQQLGVEFGGKEPSRGQRQKLSIAKIVYRDAFVMILDEPTASVDAQSEAKIFDSLEKLSGAITAILISHDFSTILQCDHIFVLEKGKLIEEGSHEKLLKKKGVYAELYNMQAERFVKK